MRDKNFLNPRMSTNELRLAVVIPTAINARQSSAYSSRRLLPGSQPIPR